MDIKKFVKFDQICSEALPNEIDKILKAAKGKGKCAVGFITTDDFYGFYLTWDYSSNIEEYYDWENGLEPDFLYQPLVDVVDACQEVDFCNPSEEKWDFAQTLLAVVEKNIKQIPDEIFRKNGFEREEVLFFATMGDGDYIQEMMDASLHIFNAPVTLKAYGLTDC